MNTVKSIIFQILKRNETLLFLVLIIAGLSLFGWFSGKMDLATVSSTFIPIAPSSSLIFIIISILFFLPDKFEKSRINQSIIIAIVLLIILFSLNIFLDYIFNFPWDIEKVFIKNPERLGSVPKGRMSPITSLLFIFICIGFLLRKQNSSNIFSYIGGCFSLCTCVASSVLLIGYLYDAPLLYGSTIIPVSLPAVFCFFLISITLLRIYKLKFWTFNLIKENKVTIQLLELFLPIVISVVILQGFLDTIFSLNHINPPLTSAIILIIVIGITVVVVIRVSAILGSKLLLAEQALKESETKYRLLISNIRDVVYSVDMETKEFKYLSPSFERITGYTHEDIMGMGGRKTFLNIVVDKAVFTEWDNFLLGLNEGHSDTDFNTETLWLCKDGTYKYLHDHWIPIYTNGKLVSTDGILTDITERKQAELALKESETKLRQLNVDKDRFLSILGHDLKSPFNNLLGLSEVLIEDIRKIDIDEIENIANNINKSARNTYNLLEDILLWARTQQGKIPFKRQNLSLTDIFKNVLEILKPNADTKNITMNYSPCEDINVFADIDMLKTIMRNLASNAIKFTNNGGTININAQKNSENVIISVSDNGIGITTDNIEKLFDISQVYTTSGTAEESGTGLGLYLCKEFVEKHGGKIWVESEVNKGSDFKFTLPILTGIVENCHQPSLEK
jgi:PAS domain S-box-containing protein